MSEEQEKNKQNGETAPLSVPSPVEGQYPDEVKRYLEAQLRRRKFSPAGTRRTSAQTAAPSPVRHRLSAASRAARGGIPVEIQRFLDEQMRRRKQRAAQGKASETAAAPAQNSASETQPETPKTSAASAPVTPSELPRARRVPRGVPFEVQKFLDAQLRRKQPETAGNTVARPALAHARIVQNREQRKDVMARVARAMSHRGKTGAPSAQGTATVDTSSAPRIARVSPAEQLKKKKKRLPFAEFRAETRYFAAGLAERYTFMPEVLAAMRNGKATVQFKKRYLLRAIDETWVNAIEDTLPAIEAIIRSPSRFIEEREVVLPVELTHRITSRTIQHLSQHTDLIDKVEGDEITPSKLLNVFREETMETYENKFFNTLINRLFLFVSRRYTVALKEGMDEQTTTLDFADQFTHGDVRAKVQFHLELSEDIENDPNIKNYTYTTDLWRRVKRLNDICTAYTKSEFVQQMGKEYIRPPVMRTNAILKNKNMRQCLALWDFIENYDGAGYSMLVQEDVENLDEEYIAELYHSIAQQYVVFRHNLTKEFEEDETLDSTISDAAFMPRMIEKAHIDEREFDVRVGAQETAPAEASASRKSAVSALTGDERDAALLQAIEAALAADEVRRREAAIAAAQAAAAEKAKKEAEERAKKEAEKKAAAKAAKAAKASETPEAAPAARKTRRRRRPAFSTEGPTNIPKEIQRYLDAQMRRMNGDEEPSGGSLGEQKPAPEPIQAPETTQTPETAQKAAPSPVARRVARRRRGPTHPTDGPVNIPKEIQRYMDTQFSRRKDAAPDKPVTPYQEASAEEKNDEKE